MPDAVYRASPTVLLARNRPSIAVLDFPGGEGTASAGGVYWYAFDYFGLTECWAAAGRFDAVSHSTRGVNLAGNYLQSYTWYI